jgi:hypothetical protein
MIKTRFRKLLAAAATVFLTTAGAADATSITLSWSDQLLTPWAGLTPTIGAPILTTPDTINLTLNGGATAPVSFFTAGPTGNCGTGTSGTGGCTFDKVNASDPGGYLNSGTIKVTFSHISYTNPLNTYTDTGLYQAKYAGTILPCASVPTSPASGKTDCINWTSNTVLVPLSGLPGETLEIFLLNAEDWAITPKISFALVSNTQLTPLPAALPLFASGLGGLGLLGWRRKKRKSAAVIAAA